MEENKLIGKLKDICETLEEGKQLILEDAIIDFQISARNIGQKLEGIMQDGRLLRLGIVGEVKAGKSSFLNALLFDGKDILPKAPTPMTAALTRISYSESPNAKVVFYNANDWDIIEQNSHRYDEKIDDLYQKYVASLAERNKKNGLYGVIKKYDRKEFELKNKDNVPEEYRSCKELTDMVKDNGLNVKELLGTEKTITGNAVNEYGYLEELNQYVGADGKYTALVKYTEVQMQNKMLEGVEIIDTPGLNDPILSRSRVTRDFLVECDAVFLLGYCGQFLAADDMKLIMSSLPNEGISKAVLIGSKMDSAILQYPGKADLTFKKAYLGTKRNCEEQARENINSCQITSYNEKIINQIKKSLPPMCVSSVAYSAAKQLKQGEQLGKLEEHVFTNMKRRFQDFNGDVDTLFGLSNIDDVRDKVFDETKAEKESIIQERISEIVNNQTGKFLRKLEDVANQSRMTLNDLQSYDCEQLETKLRDLKSKLDSVRIVVKNLFEAAAIESRRSIDDISVEIGMELSNHTGIEVNTTSKTEHHSSTSGHLWWKSTEHWSETVTTHSAEVKDAEENIRQYYYACFKMINEAFREVVGIESLKDNVKSTVMGAFDRADKEFDENKIIMPLENALNRITLPEISLDLSEYESLLDQKLGGVAFGGVVKNDNIPALKRAQDQVIDAMSREFIDMIKKQGTAIDSNLQKQSAIFIDNIVNQLEENQKKLEELIQDKQSNIQKLEQFIDTIGQAKKQLMEV